MIVRDHEFLPEWEVDRQALEENVDLLQRHINKPDQLADLLNELQLGLALQENVFRMHECAFEEARELKALWVRVEEALYAYGYTDAVEDWPGDILDTVECCSCCDECRARSIPTIH
jgi:hypothetical protein